ncbi:hypothetical protein B9Z65_1912 [Elsinoe australis]|uniref:Uncharacterized protein n=1 Tax=Elsinoe australis TaxID=40998 RepID=A0A2P7YL89_9PEZI|nr:hypothetical protein B9Z65_1912 [Elsinoe australis]
MASQEAMGFVCRSCARKARSITHGARSSGVSLRPFSHGARLQRSHAVPDFAESSSAELNNVLSTLRNEHILPAYLNEAQQRLVYRKKYRSELENSTVTIAVEHEEFDLKPLDKTKLLPKRKPLVKQAIDLITEEKDWAQVYPLLEGLAKIGNAADQATIEKLIRRAALEGHFGVIAQCLRAAERTGLTMRDKYVLHGVLRGLRQTAERSGWKQGSLDRAIRYGDEVAALLANGEHMDTKKIPRRQANVATGNPLKNPLNMATWLELHAVRAYKYGAGKDVDNKIRTFYERLVACFSTEKTPGWLSTTPLDLPRQFSRLMPLWQGVLLSTKVLGSRVPPESNQLQEFANACGESLSKTVAHLREQGQHAEGSYAATAIKEYDLARKHIYSKDRFEPQPVPRAKSEKAKPEKASTTQATTDMEEQ